MIILYLLQVCTLRSWCWSSSIWNYGVSMSILKWIFCCWEMW